MISKESWFYRVFITPYNAVGWITKGCGVLCGVVAFEMAVRMGLGVLQLILFHCMHREIPSEFRYNFSANFGGALFFSMCAALLFSWTATLGAALFCVYSLKGSASDDYFVTKIIGLLRDVAGYILDPCITLIVRSVVEVFEVVCNAIYLFEHPIWIAVFLLAITFLLVKGLSSLRRR
jgi:hypothetical protein